MVGTGDGARHVGNGRGPTNQIGPAAAVARAAEQDDRGGGDAPHQADPLAERPGDVLAERQAVRAPGRAEGQDRADER